MLLLNISNIFLTPCFVAHFKIPIQNSLKIMKTLCKVFPSATSALITVNLTLPKPAINIKK